MISGSLNLISTGSVTLRRPASNVVTIELNNRFWYTDNAEFLGEYTMRYWVTLISALMCLSVVPDAARASSDSTCYPDYSLDRGSRKCTSVAVLSPGNDTRSNLLLLLQDGRNKISTLEYPRNEFDPQFGTVFFDWGLVSRAFYPVSADTVSADNINDYLGSRCQSLGGGDRAFKSAVMASRYLPNADREMLIGARNRLTNICAAQDFFDRPKDERPDLMRQTIAAYRAKLLEYPRSADFLVYLMGAASFYGEDFAASSAHFAVLLSSKDK